MNMQPAQIEDNKQSSSICVVPFRTIRQECFVEPTCTTLEDMTVGTSSTDPCFQSGKPELNKGRRPQSEPSLCSWSHVKIKERIGSGSFAMVLKANYYYGGNRKEKKIEVALKCIKDGAMDSVARGCALECLRSEAQILRGLDHPHIVSAVAIGGLGGSPFFLMELLQRDTLETKIREWGRVSAKQQNTHGLHTESETRKSRGSSWWSGLKIRRNNKSRRNSSDVVVPSLYDRLYHIAFKIAQALTYLHSRKILHYDIKPANIGFDQNGIVKIFDFGLSEDLSQSDPTDGFQTGSLRYDMFC